MAAFAVGTVTRFLLNRAFAMSESPATRLIHNMTDVSICFMESLRQSGLQGYYGKVVKKNDFNYRNLIISRVVGTVLGLLFTRVTHGQSMKIGAAIAINAGTFAAELFTHKVYCRATGAGFKPTLMV